MLMLCEKITEEEIKNLKGNWLANRKEDGERILAVKKGKDIFLLNRRGREKSFIYPEVIKELSLSPDNFILDGEITTIDGVFNSLQKRVNLSDRRKIAEQVKSNPVIFKVFDVLELNNEDLKNKLLKERIEYWKKISFELEKPIDIKVWFVEYGKIEEMLEVAKKNNYEGIVIKNMNSIYENRRSKNWCKLKLWKETNLRIVRYTENNAGLRLEDENFNAVQCAGSQSKEVKKKIDEVGYCEIICQYLEKTAENKLRFPSFREIVKC